ncbi:MAG TPA: XdhC family protein [Bauldia sp.]|nr:XdhC family protein [Bauldia sp.]
MKLDVLQRLNAARQKRRAAIAVTDLATGHVRVVLEAEGYDADPLAAELRRRFASGASGTFAEANTFLTVHLPPPRLIVIGAVHISQALAPMARLAGFDMTIVDPRTAFATPDRFPDVALMAEWPEDAIPKLGLDPFTALAALTHDPKIDDGPLAAALRAGCFYVGALGSRKTQAKRHERLRALELDERQVARIRGPIGLPIGAQSPAEIAVSILAEVIQALRSRGVAANEAAA